MFFSFLDSQNANSFIIPINSNPWIKWISIWNSSYPSSGGESTDNKRRNAESTTVCQCCSLQTMPLSPSPSTLRFNPQFHVLPWPWLSGKIDNTSASSVSENCDHIHALICFLFHPSVFSFHEKAGTDSGFICGEKKRILRQLGVLIRSRR